VRLRKDGKFIDISLTVSPLRDAAGRIIGASKIARDITERKRAGAQQEMLVREMSHRVKNAFTVVNGILAISARYSKPQSLVQDMRDRLAALARAHDLTRPGLLAFEWSHRPTTIHALIEAIFAPYVNTGSLNGLERVCVTGPDLPIQQQSITGLALLLYELATNAVKCGSLSAPSGSVQIDLSVTNGSFQMEWTERGGPKLTQRPNHEGFGTSLVRRIVVDQFGGEVSYDWELDGLIVRLDMPSERLVGVDDDVVLNSESV
jgi:two-component sensor histidine kinase